MAGVSVGTFVAPVLDYLSNYMKEMVPKLIGWGLTDKVKKWEGDLTMIRAVLADAEQKQFSSKAIHAWLGQLKDVALDMEDVFELLAIRGHQNKLQKILQFPSVSVMAENLSIEERVADVTERLEAIGKDSTRLSSLVAGQQPTFQTQDLRNKRESTSLVSKVFERDEMKQEIIKRLFKGNHDDQSQMNYEMIPIVGAGGIGKTTLAQLVYKDEQLTKMKFKCTAWVCVSDVFNVKSITTLIINEVVKKKKKKKIINEVGSTRAAGEFSSLNQAQNTLRHELMNKKFLIVLDDIWNVENEDWQRLQLPFEHAAKGSRVIMTTRNEDIAKLMNTNSQHDNIIKLKGLSDDACWKIVQQEANNKSCLVEMQPEIISKCKGLPLAAKFLGGVLKIKDRRECLKILNSDLLREDENTVLRILRLSYYDLPSHLKHVFAYCSVFPKDSRLKEMDVVSRWMAQGLLPDNISESMETVGQKYFRELVSRSLLEVHPIFEQEFNMHDLIHHLALEAAGDICHVMDTKGKMEGDGKRARHVILTDKGATSLESAFPVASKLRTLECSLYDVSSIKQFRCIRTLILRSKELEVLPECIGDLKLLRLLYLRYCRIKKLPKSIISLSNLQTLWVRCCDDLEEIPNIGSLRKLRNLDFSGRQLEEMPWGIENLTNLRSLGGFVLTNGHGSRVRELKNLNNLQGELMIFGLEKVSNAEDAKEAQLHQKCGLAKLYLDWSPCEEQVVDDGNTQKNVLEQLRPSTSIEKCELVGYMGLNLPDWLGDSQFTYMVDLRLERLEKCKGLPTLGQLRRLERLEIEYMESIKEVGAEFYGDLRWSNAFPALKHLKFGEMPSWEKWVHPAVENGRAFAKLEGLKIKNTRSLRGELPPHLPNLRTLKITKCKEMSISLASLPFLEDLVVSHCEELIITTEYSCTLAHLTKLKIKECPNLEFCSSGDLHLPAIEYIEICKCENLESLPSQMLSSTSLQRLKIDECPQLQCPEEGLPTNLRELEFSIAESWGLHCLHSLQKLFIECVELEEEISLPSSLREINMLSNDNLKNLNVGNCTNLTSLVVWNCPDLEILVGNFASSLKELHLSFCTNLQSLPQGIPSTSLERLTLWDVGRSTDAVKRIPSADLALPSSLRGLRIQGFENLKSMNCVALPNLAELTIWHCRKFEYFDDNVLPPQLRELCIKGCDLIEPHLRRDPRGIIRVDNNFNDRYSLADRN